MLVTIISDAFHGLPRRKVQSERYHYTDDKLFEQSLDIYRPVAANDNTPIVALVVGSAWLGHRSFIYSGTSWWNSSGPKSVAELGYVCVCIRHRGSFMKTSSALTLAFMILMVAMIAALLNALLDEDVWSLVEETIGDGLFLGKTGGFLLALVTGLLLIELGGMGSANIDDMQADVMDALAWLSKNEERLRLSRSTPSTNEQSAGAKSEQKRLFIFGGYSSGGHVAATVSQNPQLWKDRNLPPPHVHCDSILYISPVLSTKSYNNILLKEISSLSTSSSMPSLSPSEVGSTTDQLSRQSSSISEVSDSLSSSTPTWLTDRVVSTVFGQKLAPTVPSPIHTYDKSPTIPHIFLGCQNEMFGLNWLDTFFCSNSYSDLLNNLGIKSRYTAVQSDHWNVLNSAELSDALRRELGWIELECREVEK